MVVAVIYSLIEVRAESVNNGKNANMKTSIELHARGSPGVIRWSCLDFRFVD